MKTVLSSFTPASILALAMVTLLGLNHVANAQEPAAESLVVAGQQCTADGVKVSFRWQSANLGEQWLEYSSTPNNFVSDSLGVGPLTSPTTAAEIERLAPQTAYYTRVNTETPGGRSSSSTLSFTTQACASTASSTAPAASNAGGSSDNSGGDSGGSGDYSY